MPLRPLDISGPSPLHGVVAVLGAAGATLAAACLAAACVRGPADVALHSRPANAPTLAPGSQAAGAAGQPSLLGWSLAHGWTVTAARQPDVQFASLSAGNTPLAGVWLAGIVMAAATPLVAALLSLSRWRTPRGSTSAPEEIALCPYLGFRDAAQPLAHPLPRPRTNLPATANAALGLDTQSAAAGKPDSIRIAVLGDLHLDPREMDLFHECRDHVVAHLTNVDHRHIISLGDLGGYKAKPGSDECFRMARGFLDGFGVPYSLVTGNHDLEADEYETDAENLEAWKRAFNTEPYWVREVTSNAVCIGLSTTRFRDNPACVHEVYISDEDVAWFERTLEQYAGWNVFVFSHAPILGCGLRALQKVHIKNMCAWVNHTDRPQRFIRIVQRSPQIRAWFSGHFHLSHDYADSISVVNKCTFVQVGVMGESSQRDKRRQTRVLDITLDGYRISTINHHIGGRETRMDLEYKYDDPQPPLPLNTQVAACAKGFVACVDTGMFWATEPIAEDGCILRDDGKKECWYHMPNGALLEAIDNQLMEYDPEMQMPLGLVHLELKDREIRIDQQTGNVLLVSCKEDGSEEVEVVPPNADGTYRRVFKTNKWKDRLAKEAAARQKAADAVAAAPAL